MSSVFAVLPVAEAWSGKVGGGLLPEEDYLRLGPACSATDGFFVAILERKR